MKRLALSMAVVLLIGQGCSYSLRTIFINNTSRGLTLVAGAR